MTEGEEQAYLRGARAAWCRILGEDVMALGYDTPEGQLAALLKERESAVFAQRRLCEEYGDNTWPDDLHLADVIEKRLGRYLADQIERADETPTGPA